MTPRKVNPAVAALMLAAIIGTAGQPNPDVVRGTLAVVKEATQRTNTTPTTAPVNSAAQKIADRVRGRGPNPNQARNLKRQARRVLEKIGFIDSGRQWKKFRRSTRTNPTCARLWAAALVIAEKRLPV